MSLTVQTIGFTTKQLVNFLAEEYKKGTGIPVHVYSVVNASMSCYNKSLAITDGEQGTLFLEGSKVMKSYGTSNPVKLLRALHACNARTKFVD